MPLKEVPNLIAPLISLRFSIEKEPIVQSSSRFCELNFFFNEKFVNSVISFYFRSFSKTSLKKLFCKDFWP